MGAGPRALTAPSGPRHPKMPQPDTVNLAVSFKVKIATKLVLKKGKKLELY